MFILSGAPRLDMKCGVLAEMKRKKKNEKRGRKEEGKNEGKRKGKIKVKSKETKKRKRNLASITNTTKSNHQKTSNSPEPARNAAEKR